MAQTAPPVVASSVATGSATGNALSVRRRATAPSVLAGNGAGAGSGAAPRRSTRAEDVLGTGRIPAARPDSARADSGDAASRWWSKSGPVSAPAPRVPAQRQPVNAGTSGAGLPIRVPMAQLPGDETSTVPIVAGMPPAEAPTLAGAEPDPSHVGSTLSRFYGGIHRAAAEHDPTAN
jgi:hypothetical protein